MGGAIATLNSLDVGTVLQRTNAITLEGCRQLIPQFDSADGSLSNIFAHFKDETKYLETPLAANIPEGLVHADAFTDNTVFKGNQLAGIIDFEEACIDQLMFDVGIVVNGFCYPQNQLNESLLKTLLGAYYNQRPLEPIELELLPWFIRWGALSQIYWHLRYGLLDDPNKRQLQRVQELKQRIEWARDHMTDLRKIITQSLKTTN